MRSRTTLICLFIFLFAMLLFSACNSKNKQSDESKTTISGSQSINSDVLNDIRSDLSFQIFGEDLVGKKCKTSTNAVVSPSFSTELDFIRYISQGDYQAIISLIQNGGYLVLLDSGIEGFIVDKYEDDIAGVLVKFRLKGKQLTVWAHRDGVFLDE